jgi:hypothetical protein
MFDGNDAEEVKIVLTPGLSKQVLGDENHLLDKRWWASNMLVAKRFHTKLKTTWNAPIAAPIAPLLRERATV